MSEQPRLFYEDGYDALRWSIASSGQPLKTIAITAYPGVKEETAQAKLSRALNSEYSDVNLNLELILTILDHTRAEDFIYFLCDRYMFERPKRKEKDTIEENINIGLAKIQEQMKALSKQVAQLERLK